MGWMAHNLIFFQIDSNSYYKYKMQRETDSKVILSFKVLNLTY